jgi:large subunit ribosomal protein L30
MINKVKDFVTWGEIDAETFEKLKKKSSIKGESILAYRLNPPRKGYGRKGIKIPFSIGGALGDRKQKINDLILRML